MVQIQNKVVKIVMRLEKGQKPNHEDLTIHIKEFGLKPKGTGF